MSGIRIRAARTGDAAAIAAVYVEAWRAAYAGLLPDSALLRMSQSRQQRLWVHQIDRLDSVLVAEHPGHGIVGVTSGGRCRDRQFAGAGEVFTLYVAPDHQGQGYGKALLTALLKTLRDAGHDTAILWVLADNHARFFYEAMGGVRAAERYERLWGVMLREVAYRWRPLSPVPGRGRLGAFQPNGGSTRNGNGSA